MDPAFFVFQPEYLCLQQYLVADQQGVRICTPQIDIGKPERDRKGNAVLLIGILGYHGFGRTAFIVL